MRLHHVGRFRLLKFFPQISLHPFLERNLPNFIFRKDEKKRFAVFIGFGLNDGNYFQKFLNDNRQRHKEILENSKFFQDEEGMKIMNSFGIKIIK